ncbi:(2Fe-2S)-binding protein [Planobispora takensis]|nr:(2Fe-2S)-binding protein [Planobispora takensis]
MPQDRRAGLPAARTAGGSPGASVARAVADVSSIGGYFHLGIGPSSGAGPCSEAGSSSGVESPSGTGSSSGSGAADGGWRPLADLLTGPAVLEDMIIDVAARLGTGEIRVAASICFQGLAARLWSPAVGAVVAHGLLVGLDPESVHWRADAGGPLPLRLSRPAGRWFPDPAAAAGPLYRTVVTGLLEPLAGTVRRIVRIAPGLLWGNAASALVGAAGVMALQRPGTAAAAAALARDLLGRGPLRGTGEPSEPAAGRLLFVRRSCCLYYRLPGGGMCGDCALLDPARRRAQRARAVNDSRGA